MIAIDAALTGVAVIFLGDATMKVEPDAAVVASAICCIYCCVNTDVKAKVSD